MCEIKEITKKRLTGKKLFRACDYGPIAGRLELFDENCGFVREEILQGCSICGIITKYYKPLCAFLCEAEKNGRIFKFTPNLKFLRSFPAIEEKTKKLAEKFRLKNSKAQIVLPLN